jgi:hypothetical protein
MRATTALYLFALVLLTGAPVHGEGLCGNGTVNRNEECDPGGELHCNGDPSLPVCRTGADCESGVNCYFALSCCKFNCQYVGQGATCFDGDECTGPDRCNNVGECVGGPQTGNSCDDGNTCTGSDMCVEGECVGSLPPECDDHDPCTDDFCDQATGCAHAFNTAPCDDGQLCSGGDRCDQGVCNGMPAMPSSCNDGNVCTDDSCDPQGNEGRGACAHADNSLPCNDSQFCTENDACAAGVCAGTPFTPPSCDDGNVCTDDSCDPHGNGGAGGCAQDDNTAPCDDGRFCTVGDQCSGGQCGGGSAYTCNDGNVCTLDSCNEEADRCVHNGDASKAGQSCDDASVCTSGDVCDSGGGCIGTPIHCDDGDDYCTADSCNPTSGCVFTTVVENLTCMSCMDGVDNEGDGDADLEDCDCNLLCETFNYAAVAQRDSKRRTTYFGQGTHAKRGLDPVLGAPDSPAPYPLGPSTASVCSQGQLELVSQAIIDGVATASTRAYFGHGEEMFLGFFTGFVPPGAIRTAGPIPYVGPRATCSISMTPCVDDSQCTAREKCRPAMTLQDPGNTYVDLSGTHPEFIDCEEAKAALDADFAALFALPPTQDLGSVRFDHGDPPIIVTGPGLHVVRIETLRVKTGAVMPIIGDPTTEAVIFQIERGFTVGVEARVELQGGLAPDRVLWLADRRGRAYIGHTEIVPADDDVATFPGTLLAPLKQIIVGKQARVAGALLGRQVQVNEKAVVSHRPFIALQP